MPQSQGVSLTFSGVTGDVKEIAAPELTREATETTHLGSTNGWREFEPSDWKDAGEVTAMVEFTSGTDGASLMAAAKSSMTITWQLEGAETTAGTFACDAVLTGWNMPDAGEDNEDELVVEATWKLSGEPTFTAGS